MRLSKRDLLLIAYIIVIFILVFTAPGCTWIKEGFVGKEDACKNDLNNCVLIGNSWALRALDEDCKKLSQCMNMKYEILNFPNQQTNPYACSISKTENGWTRTKYFYPNARLSFDSADYSRLQEAISTCEMIHASGESSKKHQDEMAALFKRMDEERAERKKQEDLNNRPKPIPTVRVVK